MVVAYVALGSNLGDRRRHLDQAVQALDCLPGVKLTAMSSLHETRAVGGPADQGEYLNAVCALSLTEDISPRLLLKELLEIELDAGRERGTRWGPRTLDLDLLLFGEAVVDEPGLTIPHPRMHERTFVLAPLTEIAPDAQHPVLKATAAQLLTRHTEDMLHAR